MRINLAFTLIELLIVTAIIAILIGVASFGYQQYIIVSRRTEAFLALTDIANQQQIFYINFGQYASNLKELGLSDDPFITDQQLYSITLESTNFKYDFTITATAINAQAQDTKCRQLTLTDAGSKQGTSKDCWP